MADTKISDFGDIPVLDLTNDRVPILDVSGTGIAKNKLIAPGVLMGSKLDLAGGTMTGGLVINPTTGAPLTVRRNSKTCFEVTNGEQINIGRYDGVFASGTESVIGWSGKYGAGSWIQGGAGNWYAGFLIGAGTGEFRIASDASGTNVVRLFNASASSLQIGANHATTPTAATIKAHNVTTGTGADLILSGGTGSVANGNVIISKLPTSNPGPGILWNDGGTPAIGT